MTTAEKLTLSGQIISFIGIVVNIVLAVKVITAIQRNAQNRRSSKDYFINEMKDIRTDYKTCLNNLYDGKISSDKVLPWFKLMNIKVDDLMGILYAKYKIDMYQLKPYQNKLPDIITESEEFKKIFSSKGVLILSDDTKRELFKFQQENNHIITQIILQINEA